jgi:hypothetical protein
VKQAGDRQDFTVMRVLKNLGLIVANEAVDSWYFHDVTPYGDELLEYLKTTSDRSP